MLDENTRILDLGSEAGHNIRAVLNGTPARPNNVYIADIDERLVMEGAKRYGFVPVVIDESARLPFPNGYFDIVYCSAVIEHVTVEKENIWSIRSGRAFKSRSLKHQQEFAREIQRVGRQYFVQTPYKHFPIESHTWLPFLAWLPRSALIKVIAFTNRCWIRKTIPDWNLLNMEEMSSLFQDARIIREKSLGLTKSIMAVKSLKS